jgi:hypothetical protein
MSKRTIQKISRSKCDQQKLIHHLCDKIMNNMSHYGFLVDELKKSLNKVSCETMECIGCGWISSNDSFRNKCNTCCKPLCTHCVFIQWTDEIVCPDCDPR